MHHEVNLSGWISPPLVPYFLGYAYRSIIPPTSYQNKSIGFSTLLHLAWAGMLITNISSHLYLRAIWLIAGHESHESIASTIAAITNVQATVMCRHHCLRKADVDAGHVMKHWQ